MRKRILFDIIAVLLSAGTLIQSCFVVNDGLITSLEINIDFEGDSEGKENQGVDSNKDKKQEFQNNFKKFFFVSLTKENNFSFLNKPYINHFLEVPSPPPKSIFCA